MKTSSDLFDTSPLTCDECRDLLDAAAGLAVVQVPLEEGMPGVAHHIATCVACREEYDSLICVLQAASGLTTLLPTLRQVSPRPKPGAIWVVPAAVLTQRWFARPALAQARAAAQPAISEERLLLAEMTQTPWGMANVEVTARQPSESPDQLQVQVNVAFERNLSQPICVTLVWAGQTYSSVLAQNSQVRFGIALDSVFDINAWQARGDLELLLESK